MSDCAVCAAPGRWRPASRIALCDSCADETPAKISRGEFDPLYWGSAFGDVPEGTRREFYSDYLTSACDFEEYLDHTIEDGAP